MKGKPAVICYTTCRDCGGLLHTTRGDTVHPLCQPKPKRVEQLSEQWLQAVESGNTELANQIAETIDEIDNRPPRLLDAALQYAAWGWPVFPLKPEAKTPATKHGFKDATHDIDRITQWWTKYPQSNIGLPTGHAFDVVDIDVPEGMHQYQRLIESDAMPNSHGMVSTASGGIHHYIEPLGAGNLAGVLPGIDFRGLGGYVVAPPSRLNHRYLSWGWVHHPSPVITGKFRTLEQLLT